MIEYGNYPPDESKAKKEEEDNIKNNLVIYRYGDKGGLRYYTNTIDFFRKKFCDVGCAVLQIPQFNQNTFSVLIELLAPKNDMKWIKKTFNKTLCMWVFMNLLGIILFIISPIPFFYIDILDRFLEKENVIFLSMNAKIKRKLSDRITSPIR